MTEQEIRDFAAAMMRIMHAREACSAAIGLCDSAMLAQAAARLASEASSLAQAAELINVGEAS